MKGKFIVFEGIDGSGTSTQAGDLFQYIENKKGACHITCEPTYVGPGLMIHDYLDGKIKLDLAPDLREEYLAYLFAADRYNHLFKSRNGVWDMLDDKIDVVCTRYVVSSLAYHCFSDDFDLINKLNSQFFKPDLMFYLDCPPELAIKRIEGSRIADKNETIENLERVSINYDKALKEYNCPYIRIDATKTREDISKIVQEKFEELELKDEGPGF